MPELLAPPHARKHPRRRPGWLQACAVPALLLTACAGSPPTPAQRTEQFADAYVQLLPVGAVMDAAQAADPRWPLGDKAALVSARQLGCMRGRLDSATVTARQREAARQYAEAHPDTLAADLQVLQAGAARLLGQAMRGGRGASADALLQGATPAEVQALVAFTTEARYAPLRHATGVDQLLGGGPGGAGERGRAMGQALLSQAMTDAFLNCHIPVSLLY